MLPASLLTVTMAAATVHLAGAERSWAETHSSRFLPSKRMMASEGAAVGVAPGVTTLGSGCQTSVSSGLGAGCWARAVAARVRNRGRVMVRLRMVGEGYTRGGESVQAKSQPGVYQGADLLDAAFP